ncbi:unnamed protein product [Caenorhabditis nigoni]
MLLIDWLDMTVPEWTRPRERDNVNITLQGLGARLFRFQHRRGWEVGTIQIYQQQPEDYSPAIFRRTLESRHSLVRSYDNRKMSVLL